MAEMLTPQQKQAIENRGGKLLVSAAAGSGKTKVLVDRLLSFLTDPVKPANLDDFLIITYTKAAAAELRGKIAAKLSEIIAQDPMNRHLQQQMQRLYMAKISTVHSFCADVLKEYAYRLDIPADFRVGDENECQELQLIALEKMLEQAYDTFGTDADFCALIDTQGFGRDDRQIPQIVLKVYNSARCHEDPEKWLQWCVQATETNEISDPAETVWGAYLVEDMRKHVSYHADAIANCLDRASKCEGMEKVCGLLASTFEQLKCLIAGKTWDEIRQRSKIDYGRLIFPKNCPDMALAEQIKEIRNACKKGVEKKLRCFSDDSKQVMSDLAASAAAARGLVLLVQLFEKNYEQLKKRRRILDFSDLEHRTLDLLLGKNRSGRTAVAMELESRFCQIMVDEYQDTNAIQDAIFAALSEKKQNCFMVGDVKQSIYQFRLADPEIFIEKYNHYAQAESAEIGQGRKVLLSNNFRSSGGVISAVNDVFRTCMSRQVGGLSYGKDEQLYEGIPHCSLPDPEVELYGIDVREDTYGEEAAFVADRICQLLDGKHMIREKDSLRPITADDIVILLRSPGSVGGEFRYALEARGIACQTGDTVDLLQTEEIALLRSLLQIISNPLQDIPLIAVLSSRVFRFTADDLAAIRSKDRKASFYEVLERDESEKAKNFIQAFTMLRQEARMYSIPQLIDSVLNESDYLRVFSALPDGGARSENIQAFYQLASDYDNAGNKNLIDFLSYLDLMEERGLSLSAGNSGGAVTIMSIHKSKGLEFPVVFLAALSRNFNQESAREQVLCYKDLGFGLCCVDSRNRVRYPNIAKRAIASKIISESISEEMRVLYVAMTRAKDRLIMSYAVKNLADDLKSLSLRMGLSSRELLTSEVSCPGTWIMQTALRRTEAGELRNLTGTVCVESGFDDMPWLIKVAQIEDHTLDTEFQQTAPTKIDDRVLERLKWSKDFAYDYVSATNVPSKQTATQLKGRLKDNEVAQNSGQQTQRFKSFRRPAFTEKKLSSAQTGTAFHTVMQNLDLSDCGDAAAISRQIHKMVDKALLSHELAESLEITQFADFFASSVGQKLCSAKDVYREFKFSLLVNADVFYPDVKDEKVLLQGVVDCFMVESDGITVIDFKTDFVDDKTIDDRANFYSSQIKAYTLALERIFGLPVKKAYLYFVKCNRFIQA